MKKIILIVVFFLNIYPSFNKGKAEINFSQDAYAQACPPNPGGAGSSGNGNSGGGFINAINNVLNAIGTFFSNLFGEDDEDSGEQGWEPEPNFGDLPDIEPYDPWADPENIYGSSGIGTGGPYDPFNDPYFLLISGLYNGNNGGSGPTPSFSIDCNSTINGTATLDQCYRCVGGTTGLTPCTPPPPRYFITVNNDTARYYDNDTIFIPQRNVQTKLTLRKEGGTIAPTDLIWKRNDTIKCNTIVQCFVSSNPLGVTTIKVDSGTIKTLIKNPLAIYKVPTLYYKIGGNYKGEYGFDDSAHLHPLILNNTRYAAGTIKKTYGQDVNYRVPWLSLLDHQTITIKDSLANFSEWAKKDKSGSVEFKASSNSNNKILMHGVNNPKFYYSSLNVNNTFNVYAEKWISKVDSLRKSGNFTNIVANIHAITNTGDTIGQMKLTCDTAINKKVVFVYVNIGTGYNSRSKQSILDSLNTNTHNQILRKWSIDNLNSTGGKDTIDLTNEYNLDPSKFMKSDTLFKTKFIHDYYLNHKGIDMVTDVNGGYSTIQTDDESKVHYVFIFNYSISATDNGVIGIAQEGGYLSLFWVAANYKDIGHEMGHLLKLKHTFSSVSTSLPAPGYNILPKGVTKNLMDYPVVSPDPTEMFYFAQWVDCY